MLRGESPQVGRVIGEWGDGSTVDNIFHSTKYCSQALIIQHLRPNDIPVVQLKTYKITLNGKEIETCKEGKFLGLNITTHGLVSHIRKTINKGNGILSQLRRFGNLTSKIKAMLVKTLLIPVITYPPICMASPSQKRKMQTILNEALRFIRCNEQDQLNSSELHIEYNITPLNIT